MKIYVICPVRNASESTRARLEAMTNWLEDKGHDVHLPHRDTDQTAPGLEICLENAAAIAKADEIIVVYDKYSQGSHFDLGIVFALDMLEGKKKRIRVVHFSGLGYNSVTDSNSFYRFLMQWIHEQNEVTNLYIREDESTELDFAIPFEAF